MSKDIWHKPNETPDVFKSHPIIVIYEAGDEIEQMDSTEYSDLVGERYANRWCYVDDLLHENAQLTHKVDVALAGLKYIQQNCLEYAADYMDYADTLIEKIKDTK